MQTTSRKSVKVGVMQGRLSPIVNNRIQQFPWKSWQDEFISAAKIDIRIIEWTIDSLNFHQNPLLSLNGWREINSMAGENNILIPSVTCDYFMENPPWKSEFNLVKQEIISILTGMSEIRSKILVIPLVDNSSLSDSSSIKIVKKFFTELIPEISKNNVRVAFECDLNPQEFLEFLGDFDHNYFGVNYDIGNSSSLGYSHLEEFKAYGSRIINVHVKDRKIDGPTVPLGEGDANFLEIFKLLKKENYSGNLILQTARSENGKDVQVLVKYKNLVTEWWEEATIG